MTMMQMMKYFIRGKGYSTVVDHTPCEQKTMGLNPVKCVIFSLSNLSEMFLYTGTPVEVQLIFLFQNV